VNTDEIRQLVQGLRDRQSATPTMLPGWVDSVGPGTANVILDSGPEGVIVPATRLVADVAVGDRVMVMFDPPRGAYVTDVIGQVRAAGTSMFFSTTDQNVTDILNPAWSSPYEVLGTTDIFETTLYVLGLRYVTLEANRIYRVDVNLNVFDDLPSIECQGCNQVASVRMLAVSALDFDGEWMPTIPERPDGTGVYLDTYSGSPPSTLYVNRTALPGLVGGGSTNDSEMFTIEVRTETHETTTSSMSQAVQTLWFDLNGNFPDPLPTVQAVQSPSASGVGMFYSTGKQDVLVQHLLEVRGQRTIMSQASITDAGPVPTDLREG